MLPLPLLFELPVPQSRRVGATLVSCCPAAVQEPEGERGRPTRLQPHPRLRLRALENIPRPGRCSPGPWGPCVFPRQWLQFPLNVTNPSTEEAALRG